MEEKKRIAGGGCWPERGWKTRVKDLKSPVASAVGPGLRFYFIRTFLNGSALTLSVIPLRLTPPLFYDETVKSVVERVHNARQSVFVRELAHPVSLFNSGQD